MNSPLPTESRGWIALGCWTLVVLILAMLLFDRSLLDSDAFLILATALVITGWVNGPVGWAYQATKGGGELAENNARIAEKATTGNGQPAGTEGDPLIIAGTTDPDAKPVPTIKGK